MEYILPATNSLNLKRF